MVQILNFRKVPFTRLSETIYKYENCAKLVPKVLTDVTPITDRLNVVTIITKGHLYHRKSFHCRLAEFHTKLDSNPLFLRELHTKRVSRKMFSLIYRWSESTERSRIRKLSSSQPIPTDPSALRRIVASQLNYWHYFSNTPYVSRIKCTYELIKYVNLWL